MPLSPAERLLRELGITEPREIDPEAIAYHVSARVRYRPLDGCEARIVGRGSKAIISVDTKCSFQRRRFSIGHELGHWEHHRGQSLVCRVEGAQTTLASERLANAYAADLLMPHYLFRPLAQQHSRLTFTAVGALAETFTTSQTATAIRLVESDHSPAMLVCHGTHKRKWFTRAPSFPDEWYLKDAIDASSSALDILYGNRSNDSTPRKIKAEAWFIFREAWSHEIYEQTMRTTDGEVLTILLPVERRSTPQKRRR
jgi:IrrE N-terminal-like domain